MKKTAVLIFVSLILVLSTFMAACAQPAPKPSPAPAPAPAPAPVKVAEWKFQSFMSTAQPRHSVALQELLNRIETATEKRVKVTLYPAGALCPPAEMINAVKSNTIQGAFYAGAISAGQVPVSAIEYGLPMSYSSPEDAWKIYDKGLLSVLREAYAPFKIHYLTMMTPLLPVTTLTLKPINSLADFKGMKIRALGYIASWFSKLGAAPTPMPMAEIYLALTTANIDGGATGLDVHVVNKTQEVCKYRTLPNPVDVTPLNILINIDAWNALSAADRDAVSKVAREWSTWCVEKFDPGDIKASLDAFAAAKVQTNTLPADDIAKMQAYAIEVWDAAAKTDAFSEKAVSIIKDYMKSTGRIK